MGVAVKQAPHAQAAPCRARRSSMCTKMRVCSTVSMFVRAHTGATKTALDACCPRPRRLDANYV